MNDGAESSGMVEALRAIARRPRSEAEVRELLERRGHSAERIEQTLLRLRRQGYVDDLALAKHYIATRAARLLHGPGRLLRELERRGVAGAVARAAWEEVVGRGELDPEELVRRAVARRLDRSGEALDTRSYRRVYNSLLRAGFNGTDVIRELEAQGRERSGTDPLEGFDHDLA